MGWQDRLAEASYESPNGRTLEFIYEDVSKSFNKHTSAFDFPDVDGTFVQDLGRSGRRIPLRIIFSGDDHDTTADQFDEMLGERGVATLRHPIYGEIRVVPFGEIAREDALKTAANQTVFTVTFFETTEILFPLATTSLNDDVQEALDDTVDANATFFDKIVDIGSAIEESALFQSLKTLKDSVKSGLKTVAETQKDIERQFNTVSSAIDEAIDTFVATPLSLAFQTQTLIGLPSRTAALISDRLDAYGNLATSIFTTVFSPGNDSQNANSFSNADMQATALIAGTVSSVLNNEFETSTEALSAADTVLSLYEQWIAWRDAQFAALNQIDTGESYQQLTRAVSLAAGFLVDISFSLKQERSVVLVRAQTPLDLEAQLYQTVDVNLDFLINSNALVGEEILEIPSGRRIVYFV